MPSGAANRTTEPDRPAALRATAATHADDDGERALPAHPAEFSIPPKGLFVDRSMRLAAVDGRELQLTYLQLELLAYLAEHPHKIHTRADLMANLWGYSQIGRGRTVDVHIAKVRAALGDGHRDRIRTVQRVGYRFFPHPDDHPVRGISPLLTGP